MTLSDLQKLVDEATPKPWVNRMQDGICNKYIDNGIVIFKEERDNMRREDIVFIVAARTYMPLLIEVAKAAKIRNHLGEEEFYKMSEAQKRLDNALAALEKAE